MSMFDPTPSFVNRSKAVSSKLQTGGVYVATVTRYQSGKIYVRVPKLGNAVEYGPCIYNGVPPRSGDRVLVGFLDNQLSELVCFGTITRDAAPADNPQFSGDVILPETTTIGSVTSDEISALSGVTDNIQTSLSEKAPIESPSLTGVPLAPTAPPETNSTQIATTEFVGNAIDSYVPAQATPTTFGTIKGKVSAEGFPSSSRSTSYPMGFFDIDWNPTLKKITLLNDLRWFDIFSSDAADITANGLVNIGSTVNIFAYGGMSTYVLDGVVSAVDDNSITFSGEISTTFDTGTNSFYYLSFSTSFIPGSNTLLGHNAGKESTAGYANTIIGFNTGQYVTGSQNTIVGSYSAPDGADLNENTIIGHNAAPNLTSGYGNTVIGTNAFTGTTSASQITVIGYGTGFGVPSTATGATIIGHNFSGYDAQSIEILLGTGYSGTAIHVSSNGHVRLPNQPAVYAYRTSNINLGDNQTIVFNSKINFNNNRNYSYNVSTGLFTAPVAGVYFVHAQILTQNDTSAADLRIAVNGARVEAYAGYAINGGVLSTHKQGHVQGLVYVQKNDTISIKTQGAINVYGAGAGHTSLVIHLIG